MPKNDRDLQDDVIRYLSDATLRSGETANEILDDQELGRARRFSRFLARRYYRDRLSRGFRYSASLAGKQQSAEQIVDTSDFDSILDHLVLGSLASSIEVGRLAFSRLLSLRNEVWWSELLEYEQAFFLQLATSEPTPARVLPEKNASAVVRDFRLHIPELLMRLRTGADLAGIPGAQTTLLFARTVHGKIYVVELDEKTSTVFQFIDGTRSPEEVAALCGASPEDIQRILATLADIGSVVLPIGG
jgi:hypothetical protein